jgi:hypothetical protein
MRYNPEAMEIIDVSVPIRSGMVTGSSPRTEPARAILIRR